MSSNVECTVTVPESLKLGFIGAGKLAQSIIKGILHSGMLKPGSIMGSAKTEATQDKLRALGIQVGRTNNEVASFADIIFVGVEPHMVTDVLAELRPSQNSQWLIVSLAAGIKSKVIDAAVPFARIVRVMPNLSVRVGAGICAIAAGPRSTTTDVELLKCLLKPCGYVDAVSEDRIDVCSSVFASMYGCVIIEALADGCVKMGMPREMATKFAAQSILGAAQLVLQTGNQPALIKDEVCSPGGTTITALHHLEQTGLRASLIGAIEAQTKRARELGGE